MIRMAVYDEWHKQLARSTIPKGQRMQTIHFAGGYLWDVRAFVKTLPGVVATEAERANGASNSLERLYYGYAER